MKLKTLLPLLAFVLAPLAAHALTAEEQALADYQQKIDDAVVNADMPFLEAAFGEDFRFKHSTGQVDGKASWLQSVVKNRGDFLVRQHSDVEVELHGDVGVTYGKLLVKRKASAGYFLQYVRVYVSRDGRWQMIMHRSVAELKP